VRIKRALKIIFSKIVRIFSLFYIVRYNILRVTGNKVFSGPFKGMKLLSSKNIPTKYLLGTYESELTSTIEELCTKSFDVIVDVGAAFGYYAIGFALRNPQSRIVAFEAKRIYHPLIRQAAQINNIEDRVDIQGLCEISSLSSSIFNSKRCLVLMDCEGGENILLDPFKIPGLKECYILVELHRITGVEITEIISKRFEDTHKITKILTKARTVADFPIKFEHPFLIRWFEGSVLESMNEHRHNSIGWFYLQPK